MKTILNVLVTTAHFIVGHPAFMVAGGIVATLTVGAGVVAALRWADR